MASANFTPANKCCSCDKYLSVPPVHFSEKGSTCGRCPPEGFRIEAYEEMAKLMTFPCSNEGCTERLKWGVATQHHEQICQNQVIPCPFPTCDNKFKLLAIKSHFESKHKDSFFLGENCTVNDCFNKVNKSDKLVFLVSINDVPTLVVVKSVWQKFKKFSKWEYDIGVFHMTTKAPDIGYDIVLKFNYKESFSTSSTLNSLKIKTFNNVSHTFTNDYFLSHKMSNIDKHSFVNVEVTVKFYGKYIELETKENKQDIKQRKVKECLNELINIFKCQSCKNHSPASFCLIQRVSLCEACIKKRRCRLRDECFDKNHIISNEFRGLASAITNMENKPNSMTIQEIVGLIGLIKCGRCNNVFSGGSIYFLEFNNQYLISCTDCAGSNNSLRSVMLFNIQDSIKKLLELKGVLF